MPSTSKPQQTAARIAYAACQGKISPSKLKGASKTMYEGMSCNQIKHYTKLKK